MDASIIVYTYNCAESLRDTLHALKAQQPAARRGLFQKVGGFDTSRNIAQNNNLTGEHRLLNIPLYVFPQFLRAVAHMLWGHLTQPRDEAFNREMVVCHFLGLMQGLYRSRSS